MSCIYFVLDLPEDQPSFTAAFVKALPVLSLAWLVCLQGIGLGTGDLRNDYITYNRRILCGLLFSAVGDTLLIWQSQEIYFMLGMMFFGFAQGCYICAFGFSPFGLKEFVSCAVMFLAFLIGLLPCLPTGVLTYMVPIYGALVSMMGWRSLARFNLKGDIPWRKIFSAVGAVLFALSDTTIAINKFCTFVPFERTVVMTTYYAAQLCMALSVINSHLHTDYPYPTHGDHMSCPNMNNGYANGHLPHQTPSTHSCESLCRSRNGANQNKETLHHRSR